MSSTSSRKKLNRPRRNKRRRQTLRIRTQALICRYNLWGVFSETEVNQLVLSWTLGLTFFLCFWISRPNFYNSEATNAEQEVLPCQAEELPNDTDQAQPHSPPPAEPIPEEPVCYSVEAVLGRQLFKPFHSFCKTPPVQESTSSSSVNQSEVPYSVDALLRSWKSAENSTLVHTPAAPAAQSVPYAPKTDGAALHPEIQKEGVCCSVRARNEQTNKSHENIVKSLSPRNTHTDPIPKTSPDPTLVSGSHKKRAVEEALKPALRAPHEAQSELLCYPVTAAETSSRIKGTNITNPVNSKVESHPPVTPSTCKASVKPPCPLAGFSESKRRAAVPPERVTRSGNSVIRQLKAEQPAENQPLCSSESSVGCEKTRKRPFHSLFAKPITGSMKPATDSALSMRCTSKDLTTRSAAERAGASTGSFLSLFSAPLLTAPQPQPADSWTTTCSQESNHTTDPISHPSDSLQLKIDGNPSTTGPKRELDGLSECGEQQRNPAGVWPDSLSQTSPSPPACANSPDQAQQQLLSSHKGTDMPDIRMHAAVKHCIAQFVIMLFFLQDLQQQPLDLRFWKPSFCGWARTGTMESSTAAVMRTKTALSLRNGVKRRLDKGRRWRSALFYGVLT